MVSGEGDKTPIATISSTAGSAAGSLEIPAVPPRPESPPDLPPSRIDVKDAKSTAVSVFETLFETPKLCVSTF